MANEYLQRTPTSTGNRKVWTWSGWVKRNTLGTQMIFSAHGGSTFLTLLQFNSDDTITFYFDPTIINYRFTTTQRFRDTSSWTHFLLSINTTNTNNIDKAKLYVNGIQIISFSQYDTFPSNFDSYVNAANVHNIGRYAFDGTRLLVAELADVFLIDGQALTPDVFGFYKQGKGYISAGSTQATDFRPGQWVPKTPRVIKTEINRRGGFGVNGFYLPMNDSKNFGADFHGDPNSIITLNEKLPQPRVGVVTTATAGIGYTDALRADPYATNLVLALPFVSGGLSSGFGDYAPSIKGSGTQKSFTANGNVAIANTASYYGSGAYFDGNGDYLRTSTNISDFQFGTGDFTIETWLWKSANGVNNYDGLASLGTNGSAGDGWFLEVSATRGYFFYVNGRLIAQYNVSPNTSQWNHLAVCRKANTTTMYLNGVAVGIDTIGYTVPATATTFDIGGYAVGVGNYWFNGYLQDLRIYKGVAKYTGGFDVPRPYTPVGIATWRAVPDTTANNFCTWNPLYPGWTGSAVENAEFTNGNLTVSESSANISQGSATIGVSTGKWYYEAIPSLITSANSNLIGIRPAEWFTFNQQNRTSWRNGGAVYDDAGNMLLSGTTYTTTDIIGIAFDMNNRRLWFSKNGSWVYSGDPNNNLNPAVSFASTYTHYTPFFAFDNVAGTESWTANFGQNPTFSGNTTAGTFTDSNGKGLFKYQPPSGFLALCEDNLPTPAISDPGKYFKTVLYTGDSNNGSNQYAHTVTGLGFKPDLVWIKARSAAYNNVLLDSVRGPYMLFSDSTAIETTNGGYTNTVSFDVDGFTGTRDDYTNKPNVTHVAWCWRAGAGTTSTNTNGSITSVVSVNQDAGFSIVSWTGNGSSTATVGHGLGKTPAFLISKARGGTNDWWVVHKSGNGNLQLNTTSALITSGGANGSMGFPSTLTSSTFTFTNGSSSVNNVNQNGISYIAYCWAEIEGFSKFGSYVGNFSTDGPMIWTGFSPALVLIKSSTTVENWFMFDNARKSYNDGDQRASFPNLPDIEGTGWPVDFLSNGFKIRYQGSTNNNGVTYVFAAFAQSPFSYSNSK